MRSRMGKHLVSYCTVLPQSVVDVHTHPRKHKGTQATEVSIESGSEYAKVKYSPPSARPCNVVEVVVDSESYEVIDAPRVFFWFRGFALR